MVIIHERPQERLFKPLAYVKNMSVLRMALWAGICGIAGLIVGNSPQLSQSAHKQNQLTTAHNSVADRTSVLLPDQGAALLPYIHKLRALKSISANGSSQVITHLGADSLDRADAENAALKALRTYLITARASQLLPEEALVNELLLGTVEEALFEDLAPISGFALRHYGSPYLLTAYSGPQTWLHEVFLLQQPLHSVEDVDRYLMRFADMERVLLEAAQALEVAFAADGIPPKLVLAEAIVSLEAFQKFSPATHPYTVDFNQRIAQIRDLSVSEREAAGEEIQGRLKNEIYPAVKILVETLQSHLINAPEVGLARDAQGRKLYRHILSYYGADASGIMALFSQGQKEVQRLRNERIAADQRLQAMAAKVSMSAKYRAYQSHFANTPEGRAELLAELHLQGQAMTSKKQNMVSPMGESQMSILPLPQTFLSLTTENRRVIRSHGDQNAFWISIQNTEKWPLREVKTRAYGLAMRHQALNAQHTIGQIAILSELQHVFEYPTYTEGWALYGEQLAAEMGLYGADPIGNLGRLDAALEASAIFVADIGLHTNEWSVQETKAYLMIQGGLSASRAQAAISRIAALPGAGVAPKLGQMRMRAMRDRAERILGKNFNHQAFHREILRHGPMPVSVLDGKIDNWIAARQRAS